jgi:hypothetical protein
MADQQEQGAWRSGKQSTLSTSPHPRLRRENKQTRCVTLTIYLEHSIGQSSYVLSGDARLSEGSLETIQVMAR